MRLGGSQGWADSRLSCLWQPPMRPMSSLQFKAWFLARKVFRKAPTRRLSDFPSSCWSESPEGRNPWVLFWRMKVELRGCVFLALIASHSIFSQGNPPLSPFRRKLWASETVRHLGTREWAEKGVDWGDQSKSNQMGTWGLAWGLVTLLLA